MCGSSGAPGGTTKYEWNEQMGPLWTGALDYAGRLNDGNLNPYQPYPGQKIADLNDDQLAAMGAIRHFTDSSGSPATIAANGQLQKTLQGDYLRGVDQNPWTQGLNPYGTMGATADRNQYAGNSPQFEDMLRTGREGITDAYRQGTSADTTRMFNLAGAFSGSAHQNAVANNEAALAKQLGSYDSQMRNDQFNRSAGLEEGFLGRDLNAQLSDLGRVSQIEENRLNRGSQAFENERGRQIGAVPGGQNEQALALQRFNARMGIGDAQRSFEQDIINQGINDFTEQRDYPMKMLEWYTGMLSRAQGGMSPNMITQQNGYSASPYSQMLGAGLGLYGLMG